MNVSENKRFWDNYNWGLSGHEWSEPWGVTDDEWVNTIYPRIFRLLPVNSILEIAPGFGRWTSYLLNFTKKYVGVDISQKAVAACQQSFPDANFVLGDGLTLPAENNSIEFVFSFDSLVHAEMDCIASYVKEIHRVLVPVGYAFIHHSNLAEYKSFPANENRGKSVSAELVYDVFGEVGLASLVHEKIQWNRDYYRDCFSLAYKSKDNVIKRVRPFYNEDFRREVIRSKTLSNWYGLIVPRGA